MLGKKLIVAGQALMKIGTHENNATLNYYDRWLIGVFCLSCGADITQ